MKSDLFVGKVKSLNIKKRFNRRKEVVKQSINRIKKNLLNREDALNDYKKKARRFDKLAKRAKNPKKRNALKKKARLAVGKSKGTIVDKGIIKVKNILSRKPTMENKKPDYVEMFKSGKTIFNELVNYETPKDFQSTITQTGKQELLVENKMSYYLEGMGVKELSEEEAIEKEIGAIQEAIDDPNYPEEELNEWIEQLEDYLGEKVDWAKVGSVAAKAGGHAVRAYSKTKADKKSREDDVKNVDTYGHNLKKSLSKTKGKKPTSGMGKWWKKHRTKSLGKSIEYQKGAAKKIKAKSQDTFADKITKGIDKSIKKVGNRISKGI